MTATLAIGIFLVTYVLIATERIHRVAAVLLGVAAMAVVGVVDTDTAFYSATSGVDWDVLFLLLGMTVMVGVLQQTGLFDYLAIWAAHRSGGRRRRGPG